MTQHSSPQQDLRLPASQPSAFEESRQENGPFEQVLARTETHSSRWLATVLVTSLVLLVLVWLGAEIVLSALGKPPLLVSGETLYSSFFNLDQNLTPELSIAIGALLCLLGLVLISLCLTPGRLARHSVQPGRFAMVVDDKVLASAISARVRTRAGLNSDQVLTQVSSKRIKVTIIPTSGRAINEQEMIALVKETVEQYSLREKPHTQVHIPKEGVI